ncbi:SARP family transcriptional regulator [Lentzea sp. NBRC 105346]|nr:SARP family transcriptional regulator [Lentzea sp. NBRC 105346]
MSGRVRVELGGARNHKVLAALLLSNGQVVPASQLVDVVWDDEPPSTAKHQIHKSIGELRAAFERAGESDVVITDGPGYRIPPDAGTVDVRVFEDHVQRAQGAPPEQAVAHLRAALGLWRGNALAGLHSRALRADTDRLDERRVAVAEQCFAYELELGRHRELVGELSSLLALNPFRELLAEQLMLALYRSDRQADALEVYTRTRKLLFDELGVDPGRSLRETYHAILNQDAEAPPVVQKPPPSRAPAQLPADLARFTGRLEHLAELDSLLAQEASAVVITAIAGTAGVGKTALAVHWAHSVRDRFPDGQLYLNLRGYDEVPPTTPSDALAQFLRALNIPSDQIPRDDAEREALYRSLLAGRRVLVLLDNAATPDQVRPLLPGTPGSAVVITSRNDLLGLTALEDAHHVALDLLSPQEARSLVARVVGQARAEAEPDAVARLTELCGYLPLALRIAAGNLASRPHDRIADAVAELEGDDRLAKLSMTGDRKAMVTAAFDLSYDALPPDARRLFRLLGLLPRTDFTPQAAAALCGEPCAELIGVLEGASLVEPHTRGRFRLHDLLWFYARGLVRDDDERDAAHYRLLLYYLHTTDAALDLLTPGMARLQRPVEASPFADRAEALSWLDGERESLVTAALHCATEGPREFGWHLADALRRFFWLRKHFDDWLTTANAGLRAAEAEGDVLGQAAMHAALGTAHLELDSKPDYSRFETALELYREAGDPVGQYLCLNNIGMITMLLGLPARMQESLEQALPLTSDDQFRRAMVLNNLAVAKHQRGRLTEALEHTERAFDCLRGAHGGVNEASISVVMTNLLIDLGHMDRARESGERAVRLGRALGAHTWELHASLIVAELDRLAGRNAEALELTRQVLSAAEESASHHIVLAVLSTIGVIHDRLGHHREAVSALSRGLRLAREQHRAYHQVWLGVDLARALHSAGDHEAAILHAEQTLELCRARGFRVYEGRALTTLAKLGVPGLAQEAYDIQRETGHVLGQAEALFQLGRADEAGEIIARYTGDPAVIPAGTAG